MGSAPFPLLTRVILAPVISGSYSGPTTPFCLNHRIKNHRLRETISKTARCLWFLFPQRAFALPIASASRKNRVNAGPLQSSLHSYEEADFYTLLRKWGVKVSEILKRVEEAKLQGSHRRQ